MVAAPGVVSVGRVSVVATKTWPSGPPATRANRAPSNRCDHTGPQVVVGQVMS